MLFRVAGKTNLPDRPGFSSQIEAENALNAIVSARNSLKGAGVEDANVTEIVSRPIKGKSAVRFSKPAAPAKPGETRPLSGAAATSANKGGPAKK